MRKLRAAARLGAAVGVLFPWAAPVGAQGTVRDAENAVPVVTEQRDAPRTVTLELQEVSLRAALKQVESQSGVALVYASSVVPLGRRVSLRVHDVSVEEALRLLLRGTEAEVRVSASGRVMLVRRAGAAAEAGEVRAAEVRAVVSGRVTDSATGAPVARAVVSVDGLPVRATTDDAGMYRLADVPAGERVVRVRRIGYLAMERRVTIADTLAVRIDIVLQAAPSQLDEVVVTGTVTPTEVKAVPTPITVITARDIELAGVARVDQLLRGTVPGAVAVDVGIRDGYPGVSFRGGHNFNQAYSDTPAKIYVDGVEMAYANALSQLDPAIIERIEITRGPQASTLYGAGAIVGVIQIFTKKGGVSTGRPEVSAQIAAGGLESEWRSGRTLQQDHSVAVRGGTGELDYNLSAGYASTGPWSPEYKSERRSFFAGARRATGSLTLELTGSVTDRVYNVTSVEPYFAEQVRSGQWHTSSDAHYTTPFNPDERRQNRTAGINATYAAASWWQHRLTLGHDFYANPRGQTAPRRLTPADTLRTYSEFARSRASAAYSTTFSAPLARALSSTLTLGLDRWETHENVQSGARRDDGSFVAGRSSITKRDYGNTGFFGQAQLGLVDALFLTAGVRVDRNDNFGGDYGTAVAPRVGVAYARQVASVRAKVRAAYGEAIRAPLPFQKEANRTGLPINEQEASPNLGPESQRGYDAGLELYVGTRTLVRATYYRQRVDDLLSTITLSTPEETTFRFRYENLGSITNSGWELEGATGRGPFSVTGTYSIYESTVDAVAPGALGDGLRQYHVGDRLLLVPRGVGGLTLSYDRGGTHASASATYIGSFRNYDNVNYYGDRFGPDPDPQLARSYIIDYPASTKWSASFVQSLTPQLSAFLRVHNIGNSYAPEVDNTTAVYGRSTMVGVKARL